ncbi:MAG TPA: DUF4214 domain-containing protein, partial [Telluria sp.]|nr:DUF4214 domain-containing protein [Telluria sp.]
MTGTEAGTSLSSLSDTAFVQRLYTATLGQTDINGDIAGFVGQLATNSRAQVAINIINGLVEYAGTNVARLEPQARFNARAAVGVTFAVDMDGNDVTVARALFADVSSGADFSAALMNARASLQAINAAATATLKLAADAAAALTSAGLAAASQATAAALAAGASASGPTAAIILGLAQLYVGLLQRNEPGKPLIDLPGLNYFVDRMTAGASLADVAQGMIESAEGGTIFAPTWDATGFVTQLFHQILGREPDGPGLAYWLTQATGLAQRGTVAVNFLNSFLNTQDALDNNNPNKTSELALLNAFDQKVASALGTLDSIVIQSAAAATTAIDNARAADLKAAAAASAAAAVASAIANAGGLTQGVLDVARLYVGVLNRGPGQAYPIDVPGLAIWANLRAGGAGLAEIATQMLQSSEGLALFQQASTAQAFVNQVYLQMLGRPLAAGDMFFVDQLNSGMSKGAVVAGILDSFFNHTVQNVGELQLKAQADQRINNALGQISSGSAAAADAVAAALAEKNSAATNLSQKTAPVIAASAAADSANHVMASAGSLIQLYVAFNQSPGLGTYASVLADLEAGRTTMDQLVLNLAGGPSSLASFFSGLYSTLLHRSPAQFELDWWVQNGSTSDWLYNASAFYGDALGELYGGHAPGRTGFSAEVSSATSSLNAQGGAIVEAYNHALQDYNSAVARNNNSLTAYNNALLNAQIYNAVSQAIVIYGQEVNADNAAVDGLVAANAAT